MGFHVLIFSAFLYSSFFFPSLPRFFCSEMLNRCQIPLFLLMSHLVSHCPASCRHSLSLQLMGRFSAWTISCFHILILQVPALCFLFRTCPSGTCILRTGLGLFWKNWNWAERITVFISSPFILDLRQATPFYVWVQIAVFRELIFLHTNYSCQIFILFQSCKF